MPDMSTEGSTGVLCKLPDCPGVITREFVYFSGEAPVIACRCSVCGATYTFHEDHVPQYELLSYGEKS